MSASVNAVKMIKIEKASVEFIRNKFDLWSPAESGFVAAKFTGFLLILFVFQNKDEEEDR